LRFNTALAACRSITQSASASLKRNNCLRSRPFSKRDKVGLRGQFFSLDGIPADQQFVDGVGTQPGRVVGIRIPASDRHEALRQKFAQLMFDLLRLPRIFQSLGCW